MAGPRGNPIVSRPSSTQPAFAVGLTVLLLSTSAAAQTKPVLETVFPPGARAGSSVEVTVTGGGLDGLTTLSCNGAKLAFEKIDANRMRITIPGETPTGLYDLRAIGINGLSSPRVFAIGRREELVETEPNESAETAATLPLNAVVNGRIEKKGDVDQFRFAAKRGQQVVIECRAERIDSRLRAVLELYDGSGRRLAVNRGYFGIDPLIRFRVPADGNYVVKVYDLIYAGGADCCYRLSIGDGPRVVFSHPAVVQTGRTTRVALYGWNLQAGTAAVAASQKVNTKSPRALELGTQFPNARSDPGDNSVISGRTASGYGEFERVEVDVTPPTDAGPPRTRLESFQAGIDGFAFDYPGSDQPIRIGLTDVPVVRDRADNHTPETAQQLAIPSEVSGRLTSGDERDWYAVDARRGEVLWIEGFAARIGAPVDLDVSLIDASRKIELARFSDQVKNLGGRRFPTAHLDPSGRFVVPADGRYLVLVRNLIGDLNRDPRRLYRLSVRRQEPDFHLVLVDRGEAPASLNVPRGGRTVVDVLAFRRRGLTGAIRVSASNLPPGISCPDVYLGPGIDRAPLTLSADDSAEPRIHDLKLLGRAEPLGGWRDDNGDSSPQEVGEARAMPYGSGTRTVRGSTVVRTDTPNGWARLTGAIPFAVTGEAPLRITANGHEPRDHHLYGKLKVRHSPGGILDVAVEIDRRDPSFDAAVRLTGVGLPALIAPQSAAIPAGQSKGYVSFYLPPTLPVGRYTIAIEAKTSVPAADGHGKPRQIAVFSNPVTFDVRRAAFIVEIDPDAPKQIARGQIAQVNYTARRLNGFIGKIHTELTAPDKVIGLRGRGVTFVGQTESGTIQIIANDDALLGTQPFVRFYAVGVVEDRPLYHGSCFLNLEIVE